MISWLTWCLIFFLFPFASSSFSLSSNATKGLICQHQSFQHLFNNHLCQNDLWVCEFPSLSVDLYVCACRRMYCLIHSTFSFFRSSIMFLVFSLDRSKDRVDGFDRAEVRFESVISHQETHPFNDVIRSKWLLLFSFSFLLLSSTNYVKENTSEKRKDSVLMMNVEWKRDGEKRQEKKRFNFTPNFCCAWRMWEGW